MGELHEPHIGKLLLGLADSDVVHQVPALVENVVHQAEVYPVQTAHQIPGDEVCLLKEAVMHPPVLPE